MKRIASAIAVTLLGASVASAQSMPGFQLSGYAQMEGIYSGSSTDFYGFGAFDMVFTPAAVSSVAVGFALSGAGIYSSSFHGGWIQGGLFTDFGQGRVTVGLPESAFDRYGPDAASTKVGIFDFELGILQGSIVRYFQMLGGGYSPGIRYDGTYGDVSVSASYHQLHGSGFGVAALGVNYDMGSAQVSAGVDHVIGGPLATKYFVGVAGQTASGAYGVRIGTISFVSNDIGVSAFYDHNVSDRLTVGASVFSGDVFSTTLYGVHAKYALTEDYYVQGAVLNSVGSLGMLASLSVGMNF